MIKKPDSIEGCTQDQCHLLECSNSDLLVGTTKSVEGHVAVVGIKPLDREVHCPIHNLFGDIFDIGQVGKVQILGPKSSLEGSCRCQDDAIGHG